MKAGPESRKKVSWQIRSLHVIQDSGKGTRTSRIQEFLQIQSLFALVSQCKAECTFSEKSWTGNHEFTSPKRGAKLIYLPSSQFLKKQILIILHFLLLAGSFECCERLEGTVEGRVYATIWLFGVSTFLGRPKMVFICMAVHDIAPQSRFADTEHLKRSNGQQCIQRTKRLNDILGWKLMIWGPSMVILNEIKAGLLSFGNRSLKTNRVGHLWATYMAQRKIGKLL